MGTGHLCGSLQGSEMGHQNPVEVIILELPRFDEGPTMSGQLIFTGTGILLERAGLPASPEY